VLTFRVALAESKYQDGAAIRGFYDQLVSRLQALPGAQSAAAATSLPATWNWDMTEYRGEGQPPAAPGELRTAVSQSIAPDFFRTLRVPLIQGRFFTAQDGAGAPPVAVISQKLVRRIWPNQDAVGKRIQLGGVHEPWRTVVGVSGDIRQSSFDSGPHATAYVPLDQSPRAESSLLVRTAGDPAALASAARAAVTGLDPDQPAFDLRTLEQLISDNDSGVEFSARFMSAFGVIALFLAAAGIFAVMAYSVKQRTHEMGIRMALGAQGRDMLKLVIGYSGRLFVAGLAVGVPCAIALSRALASLLFGVVSLSVPLLAALTLFLALVAALAAYVPARWASKVDPLVALRHE
jgi:putative ABC transport system permease protein